MSNLAPFNLNRRFTQAAAKGLLCLLVLLSVLSFVQTELHHHLVEHEHHPSFLNFDQELDLQAHIDAESNENHLFHHVVFIFFFVVGPLASVYQVSLGQFLKNFLFRVWVLSTESLKRLYLKQHRPSSDLPINTPSSFFTQSIRLII